MFLPILITIVLAFVCAIIHALGLLMLFYWQARQWPRIEANFRPRHNLPYFLTLFSVILFLHLLEIGVWAGAYAGWNCLPDFESSFYFSGVTYASLGYGDVVLPRPWRLVGVVESITGMLLLGWSAAFFFTVVSRLFDLRIQKWSKK